MPTSPVPLLGACFLTASMLFARGVSAAPDKAPAPRPPNIVLIFVDDLGYGDVGCFGATGYATPNIDRMAAEGVRLTDFYAAPLCSPSRAALLTGCYAQRIGIDRVLFPADHIGLNPDETTIPEVLKKSSYATACIGKWHLGHLPAFNPTHFGFDYFFGLPYSNDMIPEPQNHYPPLPLMRGTEVLETNPDQDQLTTRYTEESIHFIEQHKDSPFFLYLAHSMPHVPLHVSDKFRGKTPRGLYGDVVEELDWSVGQVLSTIHRLNLDDNTLVIFTSDNGPWAIKGKDAGSAGPLRGSKGGSYDGASREPFVARWPGHIPVGSVDHEPCSEIDFLPTFAQLAGAPLPEKTIDGRDIWPLISAQPGAVSPHDALYFYQDHALRGVRSGPWKLHVSRPNTKKTLDKPLLYNLESDIGESKDVAADHPDVVARLEKLADRARHDIGDSLTHNPGAATRPVGQAAEAAASPR